MPDNHDVVAFIIDLKCTADGGVKILEFGIEHQSNYTGFNGLPAEDKIASAKELAGEEALRTLDASGELSMESIIKLGKKKLERRYTDPFLFDRNFQLDGSFFQDKPFHTFFFNAADKASVLPAQGVFPSVMTAAQAKDIAQNLAQYIGLPSGQAAGLDETGCVVKLTTQCAGAGIQPLSMQELEPFLLAHFGPKAEPDKPYLVEKKKDDNGEWDRNSPTFVIQQRVRGIPVDVNGKTYDPTMRMVFLGWKENGEVRLARAGEYWKIPSQPLSDGVNREAIVSDVHDGGAAPVPAPLRDKVYQTLLPPVRNALTRFADIRMNDLMKSLTAPGSTEAENILGMNFSLTFLGNLSYRDEDKALAVLKQITEIPGRFGKPEYEAEILSELASVISMYLDMPGAVCSVGPKLIDYMRGYVPAALNAFIKRNLEPGGNICKAVTMLERYSNSSLGAFALAPGDVRCYEALVRQRFSELLLTEQMKAVNAMNGELRRELRERFFENLQGSLDESAGKPDGFMLAFWAISNLGISMKEHEQLVNEGTGSTSDTLRNIFDRAARLPETCRSAVLAFADRMYAWPPKVMVDFYGRHPEFESPAVKKFAAVAHLLQSPS